MIGERNPTHPNVIWIFSGKIKHAPFFDMGTIERDTSGDMRCHAQTNAGLTLAGAPGDRIQKAPLQDSLYKVIRRHKVFNKRCAA